MRLSGVQMASRCVVKEACAAEQAERAVCSSRRRRGVDICRRVEAAVSPFAAPAAFVSSFTPPTSPGQAATLAQREQRRLPDFHHAFIAAIFARHFVTLILTSCQCSTQPPFIFSSLLSRHFLISRLFLFTSHHDADIADIFFFFTAFLAGHAVRHDTDV